MLAGAVVEVVGAVVVFGYTGRGRSRRTAPTKEVCHA
jgi:hypothetical protein